MPGRAPTAARPPRLAAPSSATTTPSRSRSAPARGCSWSTPAWPTRETNYLGIEIVHKYQFSIANRLAKRKLTNVRIACSDARWILRDWIADASVRAVHLYFPDPWWKLKHRKRRMFTEEFARQSYRILRPGGSLFVVTDVADYAKMVRRTVPATPFVEREPPPESAGSHDMDYLTNFERKFRQQGKAIHRMRFEKVQAAMPEGERAGVPFAVDCLNFT